MGFKAGGPEEIAIPEYSAFVEQGDMDILYKNIKIALSNEYNKSELANTAQMRFNESKMLEVYIDNYRECVDEK